MSAMTGERTVLLIEDDSEMRALLRDVLERDGYRVVERPDGIDVPIAVETETFDAVVLDKELPRMNGLDVLSFLRARLPAVPVILMTAFGGAAVREEAARRGAIRYLEKPFRLTSVIEALAAVVRSSSGPEAGDLA